MRSISREGGGDMTEWQLITKDQPEDKIEVETKIDDAKGERNIQTLKRQGNLWFFPDDSMYVYYTPTHWRTKINGGI